ncbi:MAG: 2-oxo acid dehydrogenase subunit E2 [bacterium]
MWRWLPAVFPGGFLTERWRKPDDISSWRRISVGIWDDPGDPQIYGFETYPVEALLEYLGQVQEASGVKITLTTFIMKAISKILEEYPDLNSMVIGNRVYERTSNDVFCLVATEGDSPSKAELGGVKLSEVDTLNLVDIARKLRQRAEKVRAGEDLEIEQTKKLVEYVPTFLIPFMVSLIDFLTFSVSWDLDFLGVRSDPFGSAMVTSVGQFGLKQGFAPLVRSSHYPILIVPGQIHETTFAKNGEVVVKKGVTVSCTFDHRCFDGYQVGYMGRLFRSMMTEPREHFPAPGDFTTVDGETGDEDSSA